MGDGDKVHLTKTVTANGPQVITHVATTPAAELDDEPLSRIQPALAATSPLPQEHLLDGGSSDAEPLCTSRPPAD
ncbi:MAG: hypothetical protein MI924_30440 [Chloroflexales bacterium]|nr:hypothetical protein [Chloroflexales bacterium]